MASKTTLEFIDEGFQAILNTDETLQLLTDEAERIANEAGADIYSADVSYFAAGHRPIAFVDSDDDGRDEAENKSLTKAVHS